MDYGSAQMPKIAPEIVTCMFPHALLRDRVIDLITIQIAFGDNIFAPKIIAPEVIERDDAELSERCEV
jgi:hypothetical protein